MVAERFRQESALRRVSREMFAAGVRAMDASTSSETLSARAMFGGWCDARIRQSRIGLEAERVHRGYGGDPVLAFIGILLFIVGFNVDYGSLV